MQEMISIVEIYLIAGILLGLILALFFYLMLIYEEKSTKKKEDRLVKKLAEYLNNKRGK